MKKIKITILKIILFVTVSVITPSYGTLPPYTVSFMSSYGNYRLTKTFIGYNTVAELDCAIGEWLSSLHI